MLIEVLNILSYLARISVDYYEPIHNANVYEPLVLLFSHTEATIQAKVCNLIGNLCRHSDYFYQHLLKNNLIYHAIKSCKAKDKNVRKFACFAVGNAGFHSDKLYDFLRPCVPLLVDLLSDHEEKTRANAAGALGNFVRNSNTLIPDLMKYGALYRLVEIVTSNDHASLSPRRIALFSIGNLCAYPECRKLFEELNVRKLVKKF